MSKRQILRGIRTKELRVLKEELCLEVWQFSVSHLRIVGKRTVDYWPATGRAWVVNSMDESKIMSPREACNLALIGWDELPEGAHDHLREIRMAPASVAYPSRGNPVERSDGKRFALGGAEYTENIGQFDAFPVTDSVGAR